MHEPNELKEKLKTGLREKLNSVVLLPSGRNEPLRGRLESEQDIPNPFSVAFTSPDYAGKLVSRRHNQELVDAISEVVGYQPSVRYYDPDYQRAVFVEWCKGDGEKRLQELEREGWSNLERLS